MKYDPADAATILSRTPSVLTSLLHGVPDRWLDAREGPEGWSPREVVGHLIHGERTDWIPRAEIILGDAADKRFPPFDQTAHIAAVKGRSMRDLLNEFSNLRAAGIMTLESYKLDAGLLDRRGVHPEFGEVTLRQHLATWVAHDFAHIAQISRIMANQYRDETGPWIKYLPFLDFGRKR